MHPYSLNGQPVDILGGDWIVGKGAAHIVLLHPTLGQVQVFNTHVRYSFLHSMPQFILEFLSSSLKEGNLTSSSTHGNLPDLPVLLLIWVDMSFVYVSCSISRSDTILTLFRSETLTSLQTNCLCQSYWNMQVSQIPGE